MRLLVDILIVLMVTGLVAGVMWSRRIDRDEHQRWQVTREAVKRIHREVVLHATIERHDQRQRGYPRTIDPEWFQLDLPENPLLDMNRPWIEVASLEEKDLLHPPDRVAAHPDAPRFWYNPANGIVRARVPTTDSDQEGLQMYNFINDCALADLYAVEEHPRPRR